jgi:hypothetical protein
MGFGRIRRDMAKVRAKARRDAARGRVSRQVRVKVYVRRSGEHRHGVGYTASACVGPVAALRTQYKSCTKNVHGRTPQNAIGKALKKLGQKLARRDAAKGLVR